MAKITQKQTLTLSSSEATALIKNADGRVRFHFRVSAFMPITGEEGKGFEGVTFLTVSKMEAMALVRGLLSSTLEARGAKLRIETEPPRDEGGLSFITIS